MGILKIHGGIAYEEKIPLKRLGKKDLEYITGCGADNSRPAGYGKRICACRRCGGLYTGISADSR